MGILQDDARELAQGFALAKELEGCRVLITGATGLIGSVLVRSLLQMNEYRALGLQLVCPVRDLHKVWRMFPDMPVDAPIEWVECEDIASFELADYAPLDYVFHLASPTASGFFVTHPVETLTASILSTNHLLESLKCAVGLRAFVYVSSLESYGAVEAGATEHISEERQGYVDPLSPRSSYPMGKRTAECLCAAYAEEYGLPTRIARLTQTFGAGVSADDIRVFAQFAKSVMRGEDIVLHTEGKSAKPYCYVTDCVAALLYIALKGTDGVAYNVANASTYISIRDMAEQLRKKFNEHIAVRLELHPEKGYAPTTQLPLDTHRLESLGWKPRVDLMEMFSRLMRWYAEK